MWVKLGIIFSRSNQLLRSIILLENILDSRTSDWVKISPNK